MAHLEVSDEDVQRVARGIGDLIDRNQPPTPFAEPLDSVGGGADLPVANLESGRGELTIGETLTVWKLTAPAFEALSAGTLTGDLVDWVEPTNFLYHQIKLNGEPQGFARSYISGADKPPLLGVDATPFATKLGQALQKIDNLEAIENHERDDGYFAADPVVRLLTIPPCRIFALWLFVEPDQSRVMIVNATEPARPTKFENERILNSEEFYQALSIYRPLLGVS